MADEKLADDLLRGVSAIADYVGETSRQTYHLLETGQLPAFKMRNGNVWYSRKSTLKDFYRRLEGAAS
jgi:hypothetical protein